MEKDWSAIAENFDSLQRYIVGAETEAQIQAELGKLSALGNVLELGCGNGKHTAVLAANSAHILATDISKAMLQVAQQRLAPFAHVTLQAADCYATGLQDGRFDTVFMANLIHVVAKPEQALAEAHRLLKPDGRLIIVSYTQDGMSLWNRLKMIYRYLKVFGKPAQKGTPFGLNTLTEFVNHHQFKVEHAERLGNRQSQAVFVIARKVGRSSVRLS